MQPRSLIADPKHGPLPVLLLGLTVVTGIVDSVSILALGRVFVANMTGNVVFIGFALAGAAGFSLIASVLGLGGFLVGAAVGGRAVVRFGGDRGRLLAVASTVEFVLFGIAIVLVGPPGGVSRDVAVAVLAIATGMQNAVARRLAVPDLTTTVLTMTLTGIAADVGRGANSTTLLRRLLAVAAMLGGAVIGTLLVLHRSPATALALGTALLAAIAVASWLAVRQPNEWRQGH
ncbi:MAG: DUF1275 domain-containing protein [Microlunatus sp.]|nr:DUF1275 domain-containing protein [Microlunatus sp.]